MRLTYHCHKCRWFLGHFLLQLCLFTIVEYLRLLCSSVSFKYWKKTTDKPSHLLQFQLHFMGPIDFRMTNLLYLMSIKWLRNTKFVIISNDWCFMCILLRVIHSARLDDKNQSTCGEWIMFFWLHKMKIRSYSIGHLMVEQMKKNNINLNGRLIVYIGH